VGVDVNETKEIIKIAATQGLRGAKISGAGLGGIVIITGQQEQLYALGKKFEAQGLPVYYETLLPSLNAGLTGNLVQLAEIT